MGVTGRLLEGDPAIRWQVRRDVLDAPPDEVAVARSQVEHVGWGARLLALEDADGLWAGSGRWEPAGQGYFDGEVEPCINGRTVATGSYFGVDVAGIVERLLAERLDDGGWNCEAESGSVRWGPDPRMAEAVAVVRSRMAPDGRRPLDRIHPGRVHFDLEGDRGAPSRWNTLLALRVLRWWDAW